MNELAAKLDTMKENEKKIVGKVDEAYEEAGRVMKKRSQAKLEGKSKMI